MVTPLPTARIRNVEEDSPTRFLKSRILERAGFHVIEVVTTANAVRSAVLEPVGNSQN